MQKAKELRAYGRTKLEPLFDVLPDYAFTERSLNNEVDILLCQAAGIDNTALYSNVSISDNAVRNFEEYLKRRVNLEPVAYIVGNCDFYGINFSVGPGALIPRPETELLVDLALTHEHAEVIDLCCGTGCVGISVASNSKRQQVNLVDISEAALSFARSNSKAINNVTVIQCDAHSFIKSINKGCLILANPPYVSQTENLPMDVSNFEPSIALLAKDNGQDFIKKLLFAASTFLPQGCTLLVECGHTHSSLLKNFNFMYRKVHKDLEGRPRVIEVRT